MKKGYIFLAIFTLAVFLTAGCGGETTPTDEATASDEQMEAAPTEYPTAEQKITAKRIMRLGQCVEQYIMDVGFSPKTADIEELRQILQMLEITDETEIYSDGWGNAMVYDPEMEETSKSYTIRSLGSDGQTGPEAMHQGLTDKPEEDIIWGDGHWVQRFEGPDPVR